jgi:dehydrogenase/reductase SDR family member 4
MNLQPNNVFDLKGKVAIITGASKGIGEAIARYYVAAGAKVVINSRKIEELTILAADISADGDCIGVAGNTGDMQFCKQLVDKTMEQFGRVDILVNNAATNPIFGGLLEASTEAFDKIMQVNVKAPFELAKLAQPIMQELGGGSVINISSIAALSPDPGLGLYSVSKAALNMLTKTMAKEWGSYGIRANAICPGLIKTKFSKTLWENDELMRRITKNIAIPRIGTANEIAGLALFLASDAASYCTGAIFTADGGVTI